MNHLFILFAIITLSVAHSAQAEDKKAELLQTQENLKASQEQAEQVQKNIDNLQKELTQMQRETADVAIKLQKSETALTDLEDKLDGLEEKRTQQKKSLTGKSAELSAMISTALRLERAPKEAVLAMPEGLSGKVHAARAIGMMSEDIRQQMQEINLQINSLKELETGIIKKRDEISKVTANWEARRNELRNALSKRQKLATQLYSQNKLARDRVKQLSKKSRDLQSFIAALEAERRKQELNRKLAEKQAELEQQEANKQQTNNQEYNQPVIRKKPIRAAHSNIKLREFPQSGGKLHLPVSGKILASYGQKKGLNETMKGVDIQTRAGAQVIAPYDGEVMFAGDFMDYGLVVILRHSNQYHTLLAGFASLECEAGQFLLEGEPVGVMGSGGVTSKRLYMELRKEGKPINPAPMFSAISKNAAKFG